MLLCIIIKRVAVQSYISLYPNTGKKNFVSSILDMEETNIYTLTMKPKKGTTQNKGKQLSKTEGRNALKQHAQLLPFYYSAREREHQNKNV